MTQPDEQRGSARHAFAALASSLTEALASPAGCVLAFILADAQRDGETRHRLVTEFSDPLRRETGALLERGVTAGEFRADLDIERTIDAAVGSVYLRLLLGRPLPVSGQRLWQKRCFEGSSLNDHSGPSR